MNTDSCSAAHETGARILAVLERMQSRTARIGLVGAENAEALASLRTVVESGRAQARLYGKADAITRTAAAVGFPLDTASIAGADDPVRACAMAAQDAGGGLIDALMKGLVQTSDFVRAILNRDHGLLPEDGLLSHVALFDIPGLDRLIVLTDAAITTATDARTKLAVLENAVRFARRLGTVRPRVALVAASEKASDKVPSTQEAVELLNLLSARREAQAFDADGPFGLDVALSAEAARTKGIAGPVAGMADLLLLPSLDAANVMYKTLTQLTGAAVGAVVAGARVPVVLTSRADSEQTKLLSIRLALAVA